MNRAAQTSAVLKYASFLLLLLFSISYVQTQEQSSENVIYWHIKAVVPEATLLDIKAIDKQGNHHDVKAIQNSHDISLLGVKALVNGQTIPIKLIVKENEQYWPLKAIDHDGTILDVKAIGKILAYDLVKSENIR